MVYVIIPFIGCDETKLREKINSLGVNFYKINSPKLSELYFINYGGPLEDLYHGLNWGNPSIEGIGDGIVLPVNQYVGYGPNALWKWLRNYV